MKREEKNSWFRKEFTSISDKISKQNSLSYEDFLRIRNYKLQNSSSETSEDIHKTASHAFQLAEQGKIKEAVAKLVELEGVAIPIASTILAMKYPNKFAIIDRRVISELGKNEWEKDYLKNIEVYIQYLEVLKGEAKKRRISLRECEMALFEQNQRK